MGKFEKYFCMGVQETLMFVGVLMSALSLTTAGVDFGITFSIIAQRGGELVVMMFFTFFACCTYLICGVSHCSLYCCHTNFNKDLSKSFKQYLIIMKVSVIFAIIDAIWKFNHRVQITFLLCGYILGTVITIVIAYMARHELITERLEVVQNYNQSQGPAVIASGQDGIPKYPMPLHAEKI